MDTTAKTGIDAAKTASKQVVQKTAQATGDSIGNKIADNITSLGKTKSKKKQKKRNTRNLNTTREKTANYWWLEIVLIPCKNWIPKNHKRIRHNTRWST